MNSSLNALVKTLTNNQFKYSSKYSIKCLDLVKRKSVYSNEYMSSFKTFFD